MTNLGGARRRLLTAALATGLALAGAVMVQMAGSASAKPAPDGAPSGLLTVSDPVPGEYLVVLKRQTS